MQKNNRLNKCKTIIDIKNAFKKKTREKSIDTYIFVAESRNQICISGRNGFIALKTNGLWKKDYPDFDDLMDNFNQVKNKGKIKEYFTEAKKHLL